MRITQWMTIVALVALSEVFAYAGHQTWTYGVDAAAVMAYLGFRYLRRHENDVSSSKTDRPLP